MISTSYSSNVLSYLDVLLWVWASQGLRGNIFKTSRNLKNHSSSSLQKRGRPFYVDQVDSKGRWWHSPRRTSQGSRWHQGLRRRPPPLQASLVGFYFTMRCWLTGKSTGNHVFYTSNVNNYGKWDLPMWCFFSPFKGNYGFLTIKCFQVFLQMFPSSRNPILWTMKRWWFNYQKAWKNAGIYLEITNGGKTPCFTAESWICDLGVKMGCLMLSIPISSHIYAYEVWLYGHQIVGNILTDHQTLQHRGFGQTYLFFAIWLSRGKKTFETCWNVEFAISGGVL